MGHMYSGHYLGMHWLWWLLLIVLLIAVFAPWRFFYNSGRNESPLEILKKRFARGEISKEEFEEQKKLLE